MPLSPPRPQEQLLIDLLPELRAGSGQRLLCTTVGRAQFARAAVASAAGATVHCSLLDLFRTELARSEAPGDDRLTLACEADFPLECFDHVALPFSAAGEAELVRDQLQQARERLAPTGTLIASTNNARDRWLGELVQAAFLQVRRVATSEAAAYVATNPRDKLKRKDYRCEFAFRHGERLFYACSRPGVFSHRRVDAGARQLLNALRVGPQERVIEIGCGSGVVALAAAAQCSAGRVQAVDSNARAVACATLGAARNELANVAVALNAQGDFVDAGQFTLALANPPYYAQQAIAARFLESARAALAPGGVVLVVHQQPEWYAEHMPRWFRDVEISASKSYFLARGIRGDH